MLRSTPTGVIHKSMVDPRASPWAYPNQATEYTEKLLEVAGNDALYTAFIWPVEFANAANVLVNRGLLSEELGKEMLAMAGKFGFIVDRAPVDPGKLYQISREYRLSAYDAGYLELAMRMKLPLATRDAALRKAAERLDLFLE